MPTTPVVSVIIPTYNRSKVLRYAILSVLQQTLSDFELLVIGDGCTDDTEQVVRGFEDSRITWHNLPENTGNQAIPNNTGLHMSKGEFVAYLGHDDLWYPTHLETLVTRLENENADFGASLAVIIGNKEYYYRGLRPRQLDPRRCAPSYFMHRQRLGVEIGGWRNYKELDVTPDADFIKRVADASNKTIVTDEITVFRFPAGSRPNIYQKSEVTEQQSLYRQMQEEEDFRYRQAVKTLQAYETGNSETPPEFRYRENMPKNAPPGWLIETRRRMRGLEPRSLPTNSIQGEDVTHGSFSSLKYLRRLLHILFYKLSAASYRLAKALDEKSH